MAVPLIAFLLASAASLRWGRPAMRALVALALVLSFIRGGLLALASEIGLSHSGLAVNALVPALVAALTIAVIVRERPRPDDLPRPLLIGWSLIAAVAAVNLLVETIGLKLYGIGVAQYLVYPTLAIVAWPLIEPGDTRRLTRLVIATGVLVAVTVLVQATGIESFIQSASAEVEGLAANRYAGITGSYLHTSALLGVVSVLLMGELLRLHDNRSMVLGSALLAVVFSGQILTFSRSGIVIAGIGALALLTLVGRGRRIAFLGMLVPAVAIALVVGTIGGVAPQDAGARVSSGFDPSGDQGNSLRAEAFDQALTRYRHSGIVHQALGEGLAATGNAAKLVDHKVITVESYYLKLLLETGVIGVLVIGGFLLWAGFYFARMLWRRRAPWPASVAAAGLGLSLYNVIYPALETQILSLVWWLLLMLCVRFEAESEPSAERAQQLETSPNGHRERVQLVEH
jgi:O-antigen ligase